jgi:hypothetical protein
MRPAKTDVDIVLRELEIEDERQKEALKKFYQRERTELPPVATGKLILWLALILLFIAGYGFYRLLEYLKP